MVAVSASGTVSLGDVHISFDGAPARLQHGRRGRQYRRRLDGHPGVAHQRRLYGARPHQRPIPGRGAERAAGSTRSALTLDNTAPRRRLASASDTTGLMATSPMPPRQPRARAWPSSSSTTPVRRPRGTRRRRSRWSRTPTTTPQSRSPTANPPYMLRGRLAAGRPDSARPSRGRRQPEHGGGHQQHGSSGHALGGQREVGAGDVVLRVRKAEPRRPGCCSAWPTRAAICRSHSRPRPQTRSGAMTRPCRCTQETPSAPHLDRLNGNGGCSTGGYNCPPDTTTRREAKGIYHRLPVFRQGGHHALVPLWLGPVVHEVCLLRPPGAPE